MCGSSDQQRLHAGSGGPHAVPSVIAKVENGTEISQTEPHRFLHLTRSNPYFSDKFEFGSKFGTPNLKSDRKRFRHFSTVFYF
jgi:hypothetical protein